MGKGTRALGGAAQGAAAGTAILPGIGTAIGAGLGALGGLFGGGKSAEEKAAEQLQAAYGSEQIATPEQRMIQLEYLKSMGNLTPEQETAIEQEQTKLQGINVDPRYKQAQMAALNSLSQQGKTGLTLEDRSALADIQRQEAQAQRGQQEAIMQNMAARGQGGAGAELAARLQSAQSSADRAGQQGLGVAAQAQQRALDAMSKSGEMAGQMGETEFNNQAKVASAQDIINNFNTGNKQNVQQRNVAGRNNAQQYNLDYAKQLEENRAGTMNKQSAINTQANLDYINAMNQKKIDKAGAGVKAGQAKDASERNADSAYANLLGGVGAAAGAIGGMDFGSSAPKEAIGAAPNAGTSPLANVQPATQVPVTTKRFNYITGKYE